MCFNYAIYNQSLQIIDKLNVHNIKTKQGPQRHQKQIRSKEGSQKLENLVFERQNDMKAEAIK